MHQISHYMYIIVDSSAEYRLISQRDACVSQLLAGCCCFRSHFLRVVEVSVQPNRMILLKHVAKVVSYSLRHYHRSSGTQSYYFNMFYLSQLADDVFKHIILYAKAVAA